MMNLSSDGENFLILDWPNGRRLEALRPLRLFPLSEPNRWIALLDAAGTEQFLIEDLAGLGEAERAIVVACLRRHEFLPEIQAILRVSSSLEPSEWEVRTDRGIARFVLQQDSDFRRVCPRSALIIDADGIRYHIADRHRLDAASRRIVEWYIG